MLLYISSCFGVVYDNFEYAFYFKSKINVTTTYLQDQKEIYMHVNIGEHLYIWRDSWEKTSAFKWF